ncbi:hypothetical protein O181_003813 [Austropuccinia psidii MF-1]|uniref:DUF7872 domain-containing protein n=1 Tax=Austropuccinia psidii MF-1 TaxID=1389203 RepID=A0A9Q3BFE1_9BASI|nr:hypothetical protein [Austropuccinia psidii MF-1]
MPSQDAFLHPNCFLWQAALCHSLKLLGPATAGQFSNLSSSCGKMHRFSFLSLSLAFITAICQMTSPQYYRPERRGLQNLLPTKATSQQNNATGPPLDPSIPVNSSCTALPFNKKTWQTLNLDKYLQSYPGGEHLTVAQYAATKGAPNFDCGVRSLCHAGQLCNPIPSPDWYILFAVQQWNIQINGMVSAITFAFNFVQATISRLLAAFFPAVDPSVAENFKLDFGVNGAFMMVSNTIILDILALFNSFQLGWNIFFNIINNLSVVGFSGIAGLLPIPKDPEREPFAVWSHLSDSMTVYEQKLIDGFSEFSEKVVQSGINSPNGLAGVLKNGTFMTPFEPIYLPAVEQSLKNVTTALYLVRFLRTMDAFVTIGSEVCHGNGKNGALDGDNVLSYCDPSGTMYNIVRVKKDKEERHFSNAFVIEEQFGFSTQFLTNASISCQQKYGGFEHFPYVNTTVPMDPASDCVINLPVCDCRDAAIRHKVKKHGVVKACREAGLPI